VKKQIKFGRNKINYIRYGSGKKILLAFHGFGQSAKFFEIVGDVLGKYYTIYSFDLLYHGQTFWANRKHALTIREWGEIIQTFMAQENVRGFSVMGYSMGGKYALATISEHSSSINEVFLIAPDGIKTSFWYSLASYPTWMQQYFKHLVFQPSSFYQALNSFNRLNLLDKGVIKFAQSHMDNRKKRLLVYNSWLVTRQLRFKMTDIAHKLNEKPIKVQFFMGKYDKIITADNISRLSKLIEKKEITILACGHNRLIDETADYLKNHLI
jgi:pimeloyl-ACP methyl ester carboxylesterase